jgi:hypothetical protein
MICYGILSEDDIAYLSVIGVPDDVIPLFSLLQIAYISVVSTQMILSPQ